MQCPEGRERHSGIGNNNMCKDARREGGVSGAENQAFLENGWYVGCSWESVQA